jgi:hypothetical protein
MAASMSVSSEMALFTVREYSTVQTAALLGQVSGSMTN